METLAEHPCLGGVKRVPLKRFLSARVHGFQRTDGNYRHSSATVKELSVVKLNCDWRDRESWLHPSPHGIFALVRILTRSKIK